MTLARKSASWVIFTQRVHVSGCTCVYAHNAAMIEGETRPGITDPARLGRASINFGCHVIFPDALFAEDPRGIDERETSLSRSANER